MNKDILCLYYSRTGHTKFAMEEICLLYTSDAADE